jgi:hypothetical protein
MKKTVTKLLILTIAFTFALSVNYLFAAWVGPTQAPPGGNTPAPVHVGLITQTKDGGLIVGALRSLLDIYVDGKVGIGTTNPSVGGEQNLKLDVEGAIGAKYYCDENGNNCVAGNALGGGNIGDVALNQNPANAVPGSITCNIIDASGCRQVFKDTDVTDQLYSLDEICQVKGYTHATGACIGLGGSVSAIVSNVMLGYLSIGCWYGGGDRQMVPATAVRCAK